MVYLSGPRGPGRRGAKPLILHDPPPGYQPPKRPQNEYMINGRQERVLLRVVTVVLVVVVAAVAVIIALMVAGYH